MKLTSDIRLMSAGTLIALIAFGAMLPQWLMFLLTVAFAKGLVSLGIVALMRGGLVAFGQGLFYCLGSYAAGLMAIYLGVTDIFVLSLVGMVCCLAVGAVFGPILATYRGIFFAMLTLALSMVLYGVLSKTMALGSTDGLSLPSPSFFGFHPEGWQLLYSLYVYTSAVTVIAGALMWIYFRSERGLITLAIKDNELRVEYLGASVRWTMTAAYLMAAVLGGLGGVIVALAINHTDPEFAYWTTGGEFVFVAILAGHLSIPAVFASSIILELVRSFSTLYFPNTWQLALGVFLLIVIFLMPDGLGSLLHKRKRVAEEDTK